MRDLLRATAAKRPWTPPCTPKTIAAPSGIPSATTVDLFIIDRKANSFSPRTREKYRGGIRDLTLYAQAKHPELGLSFPDELLEFEPIHIKAWLGDLRERGSKRDSNRKLSPTTQWTYWMCVKMFYAWAVREQYIKRSPCDGIRGPKQDSRVIVPLSEDQIEALMRLCPPNTWWGARDRAIISIFLTTGIRREELIRLDLADLDFDTEVLKVSGKGDQTYRCKERTLALLPQVMGPLLNWMRHRNQISRDCRLETPALFLQWRNYQWERMTGNAVQRMMRRLAQTSRIEGVRVSAHTLRHTFSISCARNKIMKRSLQDLLGHRDPRSTEIYTRFVDHEMVLDEIRDNNPFKNWKKLG